MRTNFVSRYIRAIYAPLVGIPFTNQEMLEAIAMYEPVLARSVQLRNIGRADPVLLFACIKDHRAVLLADVQALARGKAA